MTQTNVNTGGSTQAYYGKAAPAGSPNLRANHTMAIRVRHTATATNFDSVTQGFGTNGGNGSGSYTGRFNGNAATTLAFYRYSGTTWNAIGIAGGYGNTTSWLHICLVYDGTNITPYVDGVAGTPTASASTFVTSTTNTQLWCGGPHPGVFCDAVFFSRALTAAEVLALVTKRQPTIRQGDCFGWYPEFADGVTKDLSGFGNDLSVINSGTGTTPTASNENPPVLWDTPNTFYLLPPAQIALAGGETVASTLAGALTKNLALAGPETVASTLAGTLSQTQPLIGAETVASTLAGTLTQAQPLIGAETVASTLAGSLSKGLALAGSETVSSTLAGTLTQAQPLLGSSTVASTLAGTLSQAQPLLGSSTIASTLAGTLVKALALAGGATSASTLSATLSQAQPLVGSMTSSSTLLLQTAPVLAGTETVASTLAGTLTQAQPLLASSTVASTLAGTLTKALALSGAAAVSSTLAGTLSQAQPLVGSMTSTSRLSANTTPTTPLVGAATTSSQLSGTLGATPLFVFDGWAEAEPVGATAHGPWIEQEPTNISPHGAWT